MRDNQDSTLVDDEDRVLLDESAASAEATPVPPAQRYTVILKGPGVSFEHEIDNEQLVSIIAVAFGTAVPAPSLVPVKGTASNGHGGGPPLTLSEFLDEAGAKTNTQKITAFAAFLKNERGQESFEREELKAFFGQASEPTPRNYIRDFKAAVAARWIAEVFNQPGRFHLTRTGERAVESGFSNENGTKPRPRRRPRRRAGHSKGEGGAT